LEPLSGSITAQSMWDLWRTTWNWEWFFPPVLLSSPVSNIPPVLHTFIYMLLLPEGQTAEASENPPK